MKLRLRRVQPATDRITRQRGMTLVELIISIVIIGIAAAALFSAMAAIGGRSADPLLRQQSLSIAEAYLEEILLQPYFDPFVLSNPSTADYPHSAICPSRPSNRAAYDNVCDYRGLDDAAARTASGATMDALAGYRVRVSVDARELDGGGATANALYVEVQVTDPAGQSLQLSGFRACYGERNASGVDQCP
ncbi:MAG TPA: prepilin-type N-terminal cleavage/methylation domain-containing protein [Kineobactrum sp.]